MCPAMNRALLTLIAIAGITAGALHFVGQRRRRGRAAPAHPGDESILMAVREGLPDTVDARVRDGVVALRGTCSLAERDRMLTHALSIPGVRRVYSDLEHDRPLIDARGRAATA